MSSFYPRLDAGPVTYIAFQYPADKGEGYGNAVYDALCSRYPTAKDVEVSPVYPPCKVPPAIVLRGKVEDEYEAGRVERIAEDVFDSLLVPPDEAEVIDNRRKFGHA